MVTVLGVNMPLQELIACLERDVAIRHTVEDNEIAEGVYMSVCNSCGDKEFFAGYSDTNSNMKTWSNQCDKEHTPEEERERSLGFLLFMQQVF